MNEELEKRAGLYDRLADLVKKEFESSLILSHA
jgi:hypothetical protein